MKKIYIPIIFILCLSGTAKPDRYPRNYNIDVLHYTFNLSLNDTSRIIKGYTVIQIRVLAGGINEFNLDFNSWDSSYNTGMAVSEVNEDNNPITFSQSDEKLKIILAHPAIKNQIINVSIKYSGIPKNGLIISRNKFGDKTFFGDNWPNRVHYWLPVIDHPYDKAACDFYVTAPVYFQVIANGALINITNLNNNYTLTHWRESEPISTYLMVIGAARFAVEYLPPFIQEENKTKSIPVETWVYPQDKKNGFYDFKPAENIIKYFTDLIGPYPFEKLANVESTTMYGGMENASNIFYAEQEVRGNHHNLATIAHETAHQWFGDAVTEDDWNHIWLSEGFATFFANIFIGHVFGKDSLINSFQHDRELIINYDEANPNSPVVDTTITDLPHLLNINSYQKGSWVLRMLLHKLGEENFWKGIRRYYKAYRYKNALTKDFEKIMEKVSYKNLTQFFNEWIYRPGFPILKGGWKYDKQNKSLSISLTQVQSFKNSFHFPLDIGIYIKDKQSPIIKTFNIGRKENIFMLSFDSKPSKIVLDPDSWMLMGSEFNEN